VGDCTVFAQHHAALDEVEVLIDSELALHGGRGQAD